METVCFRLNFKTLPTVLWRALCHELHSCVCSTTDWFYTDVAVGTRHWASVYLLLCARIASLVRVVWLLMIMWVSYVSVVFHSQFPASLDKPQHTTVHTTVHTSNFISQHHRYESNAYCRFLLGGESWFLPWLVNPYDLWIGVIEFWGVCVA